MLLGTEPKALYLPGKLTTTCLYPQEHLCVCVGGSDVNLWAWVLPSVMWFLGLNLMVRFCGKHLQVLSHVMPPTPPFLNVQWEALNPCIKHLEYLKIGITLNPVPNPI